MKCKDKCLICKNSIVGDKCSTNADFEPASSRLIEERLIVYNLRLKYLTQNLTNSKTDTNNKYVKKQIKETKEIISILNKTLFDITIIEKPIVNNKSIFCSETIKIK